MLDPGQILIFMSVVAVLFLIPGPAVILTLARSVSGGARVGVATGAGVAVGDALHTLAAVIGLSAILMTSSLAFEIVRYLGAAYLVFLGIVAMWERTDSLNVPDVPKMQPGRAFRQAIIIEILNPKTALFFLAFLPQFTDPTRGALWLQLLLLGAIFVAMSLAYTSLLAISAARVSRWIGRNGRIGRWQGKVVGGIYIALGVQLALQERK